MEYHLNFPNMNKAFGIASTEQLENLGAKILFAKNFCHLNMQLKTDQTVLACSNILFYKIPK